MESINPNMMPPPKRHRSGRLLLLLLALTLLLVSAQSLIFSRADAESSLHDQMQEAQVHELQMERAADTDMASSQYDQALTTYAQAISKFEPIRDMNTSDDNRLDNLYEKLDLAFCHASQSAKNAFLEQRQKELTPIIDGMKHTLKLVGYPASPSRAADMARMHVIIADYLRELRRYADAEAEYMTAKRLKDDWQVDETQDRDTAYEFYSGLGKACHQTNHLQMAADCLRKAIAIKTQQVGDGDFLSIAYLELELAQVLSAQGKLKPAFEYLEKSYYRQVGVFQWPKHQAKLGDFVMGETALEMYRYYAHRLDAIMCDCILGSGIARLSSRTQQYLHNTQGFFLPKREGGYPQLPCLTPDKEE